MHWYRKEGSSWHNLPDTCWHRGVFWLCACWLYIGQEGGVDGRLSSTPVLPLAENQDCFWVLYHTVQLPVENSRTDSISACCTGELPRSIQYTNYSGTPIDCLMFFYTVSFIGVAHLLHRKILICPSYRWDNWSLERVNNLPKLTELVNAALGPCVMGVLHEQNRIINSSRHLWK